MRQASSVFAFFVRRRSSSFFTYMLAAAIAACSVAAPTVASANPKYASIVIDANTGKVLHQSSADAPRYPASLTKMMTLYMIFEALQSGRISKSTKVPFSKHAAAKPPTKLGVRAGGSVTVETVIYSLVTKSANDAAAAVGELLAGSESNFAKQMTAKARSLGMNATTFRNASGLPDNGQKTTARDMATLGIALREHFPNYYDYFSTRSYKFGKSSLTNHNKLLGSVKGVDGIKTGYIRASGFNLVSSVKTGGRSVVAVVMGGRTGASRDAHMRELIQKHLPRASNRAGGPLLAAGKSGPSAFVLPAEVPVPSFRPSAGFEPEQGIVSAYAPSMPQAPQPFAAPAPLQPAKPADVFTAPVPPAPIPAGLPTSSVPAPERFARLPDGVDPFNTASTPVSGWAIQVASMPSEAEARLFLMKTSLKAPTLLADAAAFTETFDNNGMVYYRARFGGFDSKTAAWNACSELQKQKIACYAVQR